MKLPESGHVSLADLDIDLGKRAVLRAGAKLPIKGKSYDLLRHLVERHPGTASHADILESVWEGVVVSQDTLMQRVKLLRKALGETGKEERYIASVHGTGYRLVPAPSMAEPGAKPSAAGGSISWGKLRLTALVLLLAVVVLVTREGMLFHAIKHAVKHAFYAGP